MFDGCHVGAAAMVEFDMKRYVFVFPLLIIALVMGAIIPPSVGAECEGCKESQPTVKETVIRAAFATSLAEDRPLQYLEGNQFISFKPVGGLPSVKTQMTDPNRVRYGNALGVGISIEMEITEYHWRKLIKIDSLAALGDLTGKSYVEFMFEVESDFDIPIGENKKPEIRLGESSYIEVAQAWDSMPHLVDPGTRQGYENKIPIKSYFTKGGAQTYLLKRIPVSWLQTAAYPVWTDLDITWGAAQEFEAGETHWCQCCEIDTDKFVVVYTDKDDASAGKARVGNVTGNVTTWMRQRMMAMRG